MPPDSHVFGTMLSLLSWVVANAVMAMAAVVAMAPKATKAPKAEAKPKEKAKGKPGPKVKGKAAAVKTEQSSPAKRPRREVTLPQQVEAGSAADAGGNAEVSKADVSNVLGRLKNSADPNHQKVLLEYQMQPRYDKSKAELIRRWKMDRSCSWAHEIKEEEKKETLLANNSLVGWITKWELADALKMSVDSPVFQEMLGEFETSCEQWDMNSPAEAFLSKKGEVKYWFSGKLGGTHICNQESKAASMSKTAQKTMKDKGDSSSASLTDTQKLEHYMNELGGINRIAAAICFSGINIARIESFQSVA